MAKEISSERLRLFVAISISELVRNEMIAVQRDLKPLALGDVRWTNVEQLHLTLLFLGNVQTGSLEAVKQSLTVACAGVPPFHLRGKGIGFFPNERQSRVIWVGFGDDHHALMNLQQRVAAQLAPFVEKPGEGGFLAHTTLGRFQKYRRYKSEKLVPNALTFAGHDFGEWQVGDIGLFRSELSAAGARHSTVAVFPLGANLEL